MKTTRLIALTALASLALAAAPTVAHADRSASNQYGPGDATNNISATTKVGQGFISSGTSYNGNASGAAEGKSTAQFMVDAGQLTLDKVPDMNFQNGSVANIVSADQTLALKDNTVGSGDSKNSTAFDGNNSGTLSVTDYTGSNNGWTVLAALGQFTSNSGASKINNATLNLSASNQKSLVSGTAAAKNISLNSAATADAATWPTASVLWSTDKNTGEGTNTEDFVSAANTLTIKQQNDIQPTTYQANLFWTLQNAPTATPAN
ncbi:WxL domain-containing protein [Furfurilactobacillus sp. WILCCON 0119]